MQLGDYRELKLQRDIFLQAGEQHRRNLLLDSGYASVPKDSEVKVMVFQRGDCGGRLHQLALP